MGWPLPKLEYITPEDSWPLTLRNTSSGKSEMASLSSVSLPQGQKGQSGFYSHLPSCPSSALGEGPQPPWDPTMGWGVRGGGGLHSCLITVPRLSPPAAQ